MVPEAAAGDEGEDQAVRALTSANEVLRHRDIAQLSPTWESRAIFVGFIDNPPNRLIRAGIPEGSGAIVRLLIVAAVALLIATRRMSRMSLAGASD